MNKKEMYQKWENEILFPTLQNTVFIMQKEIQQNIEQIQKTICAEIEKLFYKAAKKQCEQKINYITWPKNPDLTLWFWFWFFFFFFFFFFCMLMSLKNDFGGLERWLSG